MTMLPIPRPGQSRRRLPLQFQGRNLWIGCLILFLAACGGGGSGSSEAPPPPGSGTPPPPTTQQLAETSRLTAQATFGVTWTSLNTIATQGTARWLDTQFAEPASFSEPVIDELVRRRDAGEFAAVEEDIELLASFRRYAWWHNAIAGEDQLRQRVAFALSEILVVGDSVDAFIIDPYALGTYYDTLLSHAFGNYRDLLLAVTLHPAMGVYLSHVNNRKADPSANTFPDENYAREVMQLFSIGLFMLNPDGTLQLDGNGQPVPTYDNTTIREYARVFTGLSFGGDGAAFGNPAPNFRTAMQMFESQHDSGPKQLLLGQQVPAGQTGMQDLEDAIDSLFNHPNTAPFISRQLIQRLVTSNPSPAYVARVAAVFNGEGGGVRGDLSAVVRAILLDAEARSGTGNTAGKLREPVVRYVSLIRALDPQSADGWFFNGGYLVQAFTRQHPLSSPSVFNFFLPGHSPAGPIAEAGLVAPEFQITNSTSIVGVSNLVDFAISGDFVVDVEAPFARTTLSYAEWEALAPDIDRLLDRMDILFMSGTLSDTTRAAIADVIKDVPDPRNRVKVALYLILISPDYAIEGAA